MALIRKTIEACWFGETKLSRRAAAAAYRGGQYMLSNIVRAELLPGTGPDQSNGPVILRRISVFDTERTVGDYIAMGGSAELLSPETFDNPGEIVDELNTPEARHHIEDVETIATGIRVVAAAALAITYMRHRASVA